MLTTILWWGRIDDLSCRLLTDALRAVDPGHPVRIHVFAAAARDLFRHTLRTLMACLKGRPRGGCSGRSTRRRRDELIAAVVDLRRRTCLRPRVTLVQGPEAAASFKETLSAVLIMCDSIADFLEQVLPPLARHTVRAFILETRAEFEELAARCMDHQLYTESLTVTQMSAKSVCVELEASLGPAGPPGSPAR